MSLFVHDPRSRGKSPGRERSRSRDRRAPSPPEVRPKYSSKETTKKSSGKYYSDEESDSGTRSRKPSKKYYDDDSFDSDSASRSKKPSKKYYDDDSSDSDSRSRNKKASKKYYDDQRDKSDSDSGSDRRKSKSRSARPRYEVAEPKNRRTSPPDTHSTASTRKDNHVQSSKLHYDRERQEGRHARHTSPDRHEPGRPSGYSRHLSYTNEGPEHRSPGTTLPGQYKWEYDHPPESHDRNHRSPATSGPEETRHLSISATGNFNGHVGLGHNPQPQYGHTDSPQYTSQPLSPQFTQSAQPQYRPENLRHHSGSFSSATNYPYADPPPLAYNVKPEARKLSYTQSAQPQFVEVKPRTSALLTSPTEGLGSKLHRLSVSGGVAGGLSLGAPSQGHGHTQGGLPPASPLLEPYHGTYQSISPMPSPLMLPSTMDDDLSDLDPLSRYSSDDSRRGLSHKSILKKRVAFYDPEEDALALAAALKHSKPDAGTIIRVLPRLSDDNVIQLRTEYKKHIKVNGKGINIAKHIKVKVPGNLGKIAYAVALGRWESEAHWANFWYLSNSSRRELLIESLMGRTNSEIARIKEAFSDKRYNDSLEKCMQTELKRDKFRNAILLALEEKRMGEAEKLSIELVQRDAQDLYRALTAKEGGETAMINIIIVRSDNHLREVLRVFEEKYRRNFAREMIQKSRNLVVRSSSIFFASPLLNTFHQLRRARPLRTSLTA